MILDMKKLCTPSILIAKQIVILIKRLTLGLDKKEESTTYSAVIRLKFYLETCIAGGMDPIEIPGRHRLMYLSILTHIEPKIGPTISFMITEGTLNEEDYPQ